MLLIKASAKPSKINGLGLFADEKIPKGTVIWKFDPRFDLSFSQDEVEKMTPTQKKLIMNYAYLSITQNKYIYAVDDSRFANHSCSHFNTDVVLFDGEAEKSFVANRDIDNGEEILDNYRFYDASDAASDEEYLSK